MELGKRIAKVKRDSQAKQPARLITVSSAARCFLWSPRPCMIVLVVWRGGTRYNDQGTASWSTTSRWPTGGRDVRLRLAHERKPPRLSSCPREQLRQDGPGSLDDGFLIKGAARDDLLDIAIPSMQIYIEKSILLIISPSISRLKAFSL